MLPNVGAVEEGAELLKEDVQGVAGELEDEHVSGGGGGYVSGFARDSPN